MAAITTHVLDTAQGRPAAGVPVRLERVVDGEPVVIGQGETNADGRLADLLGEQPFVSGEYVLHFETDAYFQRDGRASFYPSVSVRFRVDDAAQHHHVPLLLSPFGYSTYRGS